MVERVQVWQSSRRLESKCNKSSGFTENFIKLIRLLSPPVVVEQKPANSARLLQVQETLRFVSPISSMSKWTLDCCFASWNEENVSIILKAAFAVGNFFNLQRPTKMKNICTQALDGESYKFFTNLILWIYSCSRFLWFCLWNLFETFAKANPHQFCIKQLGSRGGSSLRN